jgi:hypothetical protein
VLNMQFIAYKSSFFGFFSKIVIVSGGHAA